MYRIAVKELQERRQHLGLSSQEVAEKLGVSDSLVSLWECGKKQPSSTMFFNWITVLGFNFILNVHQSQIPKTFEPSYDTKRWITEEFGERYNYEQELKIFINHYRAGGTINQIGNTLSDLGYCVPRNSNPIQLKPPRILKNAVNE